MSNNYAYLNIIESSSSLPVVQSYIPNPIFQSNSIEFEKLYGNLKNNKLVPSLLRFEKGNKRYNFDKMKIELNIALNKHFNKFFNYFEKTIKVKRTEEEYASDLRSSLKGITEMLTTSKSNIIDIKNILDYTESSMNVSNLSKNKNNIIPYIIGLENKRKIDKEIKLADVFGFTKGNEIKRKEFKPFILKIIHSLLNFDGIFLSNCLLNLIDKIRSSESELLNDTGSLRLDEELKKNNIYRPLSEIDFYSKLIDMFKTGSINLNNLKTDKRVKKSIQVKSEARANTGSSSPSSSLFRRPSIFNGGGDPPGQIKPPVQPSSSSGGKDDNKKISEILEYENADEAIKYNLKTQLNLVSKNIIRKMFTLKVTNANIQLNNKNKNKNKNKKNIYKNKSIKLITLILTNTNAKDKLRLGNLDELSKALSRAKTEAKNVKKSALRTKITNIQTSINKIRENQQKLNNHKLSHSATHTKEINDALDTVDKIIKTLEDRIPGNAGINFTKIINTSTSKLDINEIKLIIRLVKSEESSILSDLKDTTFKNISKVVTADQMKQNLIVKNLECKEVVDLYQDRLKKCGESNFGESLCQIIDIFTGSHEKIQGPVYKRYKLNDNSDNNIEYLQIFCMMKELYESYYKDYDISYILSIIIKDTETRDYNIKLQILNGIGIYLSIVYKKLYEVSNIIKSMLLKLNPKYKEYEETLKEVELMLSTESNDIERSKLLKVIDDLNILKESIIKGNNKINSKPQRYNSKPSNNSKPQRYTKINNTSNVENVSYKPKMKSIMNTM